jgi:hypothetical protein
MIEKKAFAGADAPSLQGSKQPERKTGQIGRVN